MPKGGKFVNEKVEAAKDKKESAKSAAKDKAGKDAEDRLWAAAGEGDKSKAQKKKEEEDKKKAETAAKKAEAKRLADEEEAALSKTKSKVAPVAVAKVTAYQLQQQKDFEERQREDELRQRDMAARRVVSEEHYEKLVATQNQNRNGDLIEASGVDAALSVLNIAGEPSEPDKHPEKRAKAAWKAFEERTLPELRADKPGLKLNQYKEMMWKQWLKSPDNPLNQPLV